MIADIREYYCALPSITFLQVCRYQFHLQEVITSPFGDSLRLNCSNSKTSLLFLCILLIILLIIVCYNFVKILDAHTYMA